jgi:hypothetical protein
MSMKGGSLTAGAFWILDLPIFACAARAAAWESAILSLLLGLLACAPARISSMVLPETALSGWSARISIAFVLRSRLLISSQFS